MTTEEQIEAILREYPKVYYATCKNPKLNLWGYQLGETYICRIHPLKELGIGFYPYYGEKRGRYKYYDSMEFIKRDFDLEEYPI